MTREERNAYSRGYKAGKAKGSAIRKRQNRYDYIVDRAYLALIPVVFGPQFNWGTKENGVHTLYKTVEERLNFAFRTAHEAAMKVASK